MVCPVRYVRFISYGSLFSDLERVRVILAPFEKDPRVPHLGHVTREINPLFVIDATTCPRSS